MLSCEEIAATFKETYECTTELDVKFMKITGSCCVDFAFYVAEMARNEALEEAAAICGKLKNLDATACAEALRALQD